MEHSNLSGVFYAVEDVSVLENEPTLRPKKQQEVLSSDDTCCNRSWFFFHRQIYQ